MPHILGNSQCTGTLSTVTKIASAILGQGPGIFFLPGAVYVLGWIAAPCVLVIAAVLTWYMSLLLAQTYDSGKVTDVKQHRSYKDAVSRLLGESCPSILPYSSLLTSKVSQYSYVACAGRKYVVLYVVSRYIDDIGTGIICILVGGFAMGSDHFLDHRHMPHVRDGACAIAVAISAPTCCT